MKTNDILERIILWLIIFLLSIICLLYSNNDLLLIFTLSILSIGSALMVIGYAFLFLDDLNDFKKGLKIVEEER